MKVGDLVRIKRQYCSDDDDRWLGVLVEYIPESEEAMGEREWVVQWAHNSGTDYEYEYYLEVLDESR